MPEVPAGVLRESAGWMSTGRPTSGSTPPWPLPSGGFARRFRAAVRNGSNNRQRVRTGGSWNAASPTDLRFGWKLTCVRDRSGRCPGSTGTFRQCAGRCSAGGHGTERRFPGSFRFREATGLSRLSYFRTADPARCRTRHSTNASGRSSILALPSFNPTTGVRRGSGSNSGWTAGAPTASSGHWTTSSA